MSVDVDLVNMIKAALGVQSVYHLAVYQQLDADDVFPCVVYDRQDDAPIEELDGNSGWWQATFNVYVMAGPDSDVLRDWADLLKPLSGTYDTLGWVQWTGDGEQYEGPEELQEEGVRMTLLTVTFTRNGV